MDLIYFEFLGPMFINNLKTNFFFFFFVRIIVVITNHMLLRKYFFYNYYACNYAVEGHGHILVNF